MSDTTAADFGVVYTDLIARLGSAGRFLSETSNPLSTLMVTDFLDEAAARVTRILRSTGALSPAGLVADLSEEVKVSLRPLLLDYAHAESLHALKRSGSVYKEKRRQFEEGLEQLRTQQDKITGLEPVGQVRSNVDSSRRRRRKFGSGWQP